MPKSFISVIGIYATLAIVYYCGMSETYELPLSDGSYYPYQIKPSARAKYVRIKLSNQGVLWVTLPRNTAEKVAHEFILSKREWVEKNLQSVTVSARQRPHSLDLQLISELWTIDYVPTDDKDTNKCHLVADAHSQKLLLSGPSALLDDVEIVSKLLTNWLKTKAKTIFPAMLQNLAELHGFHYRRLAIRAQKTRWGSCSQDKNINLNCKLLLMPEPAVRYVMIHELCHTLEMNHSARFWRLVEDCDKDYREHQHLIKEVAKDLPF